MEYSKCAIDLDFYIHVCLRYIAHCKGSWLTLLMVYLPGKVLGFGLRV